MPGDSLQEGENFSGQPSTFLEKFHQKNFVIFGPKKCKNGLSVALRS